MIIRIYNHSFHEVVSGGDVIVAEFAKAWRTQGHTITISTHKEAVPFFRSRRLPMSMLDVATRIPTRSSSVLLGSIAHVINATLDAIMTTRTSADVTFSCSWSIQDLFPALINKLRNPKTILVVGCYILLSAPWVKSYGSNWLNRFLFYLEYCVGIFLTRICADVIWTASPVDATYIASAWRKRVAAIRGGVDTTMADRAMGTVRKKLIDAVYIGRFHPQKNILELVDIWKQVVHVLPHARLVIAGAGFLKSHLETLIRQNHLDKHIIVRPPIDGSKKFILLAQSKLFISASHFDTGNLALDEALACATPGVIYNLPKIVYLQGVKTVTLFDTQQFANIIVYLLTHEKQQKHLSHKAYEFGKLLDWNTQAYKALDSLT